MAIFRVEFSSMTAHYGPRYIEANDEYMAKRAFAHGAFSESEIRMMTARRVNIEDGQEGEN